MIVSFNITTDNAKRVEHFLRLRYKASNTATLGDLCKVAVLDETAKEAAKAAENATIVMNTAKAHREDIREDKS